MLMEAVTIAYAVYCCES